jgi:ABC-type lipoprotein release transport system permease subunit
MSDDSVNRADGAGRGLVWLETLMRDLRYGVLALPGNLSPRNPPTYLCVLLVVSGIGLCASVFPVRRATQIVPMEALRQE